MANKPVPNSPHAGRIYVPAHAKDFVWVRPVGRGMQLWQRVDGDEGDFIGPVPRDSDVRALLGSNQRREDIEIYLNDYTLELTNGDGTAPKKQKPARTASPEAQASGNDERNTDDEPKGSGRRGGGRKGGGRKGKGKGGKDDDDDAGGEPAEDANADGEPAEGANADGDAGGEPAG